MDKPYPTLQHCSRERGHSARALRLAKNFHESYKRDNIRAPSDRGTGLVFASLAAIVALFWRQSQTVLWLALGISVSLATVSLTVPRVLGPLNQVWFKLGLLLHRIVNPIVMLAIFVLIFVPAGFVMRIWRDPLRSRRNADGFTYWIKRGGRSSDSGSMTNQF